MTSEHQWTMLYFDLHRGARTADNDYEIVSSMENYIKLTHTRNFALLLSVDWMHESLLSRDTVKRPLPCTLLPLVIMGWNPSESTSAYTTYLLTYLLYGAESFLSS